MAWFGLAWLLVWVAGLGLVGRVGLDRVVNDKDRQKNQKKKTKKTSVTQQAKETGPIELTHLPLVGDGITDAEWDRGRTLRAEEQCHAECW